MKKAKLSLDKLVVASLTEAEEKLIIGGDDPKTNFIVNTICVSNDSQATTQYLQGCMSLTPTPTASCKTIPAISCH